MHHSRFKGARQRGLTDAGWASGAGCWGRVAAESMKRKLMGSRRL